LLCVVGAAARDVAHVRGLGIQRGDVGVVPADLQQVREQYLEPFGLALQELGRTGGGGVELFPRLVEDLRGHPDCRHRRAQLVRHVRDELPLRPGQLLQFAQLLLQAVRHVVEGRGQRTEVVRAADRHPLLKPSRGQALRRPRRVPDR
jgi:hypothetical protein